VEARTKAHKESQHDDWQAWQGAQSELAASGLGFNQAELDALLGRAEELRHAATAAQAAAEEAAEDVAASAAAAGATKADDADKEKEKPAS
jgi:hypothetical protein